MTKPREGTVRPTQDKGPLFDSFNLEIFFRGEWVHFGSIGNWASNNTKEQIAYRKLCHAAMTRFLDSQKK